jgi:hypothetical protein
MNYIIKYKIKKILEIIGLKLFIKKIIDNIKIKNIKNIIIIENKIRQNKKQLIIIKKQTQNKIKNNKFGFIIGQTNYENIISQLPLILGLIANQIKPVIIFKNKEIKRYKKIYEYLGVENYDYWSDNKDIDIKNINEYKITIKNQEDLVNIKYKNIEIGKYCLSTIMRRRKEGQIDFKNKNNIIEIKEILLKSIIEADESIKFIERWNPKIAIFIDRGYNPEGALFDACLINDVKIITCNVAHKNNAYILKKYNKNNKNEHPVSVSTENFKKIAQKPWSNSKEEILIKEIEECYIKGEWYGEVATQYNTKKNTKQELINILNIDSKKKTAIIFPHIFWDGTFFYGEDIFENYEDWFREIIKFAFKSDQINWVIKIHPANIIKNLRDNKKSIKTEIDVIKKLGVKPEHIKIIEPETKISTLSLLEIGDYCLTVRGTIGIEAALKGLTVLTAGTGRYNGLGFTVDSENKVEYFKNLTKMIGGSKFENINFDNAKKFGYAIFIDRTIIMDTIKFNYTNERNAKLKVKINTENLKDLFENKDIKNIIKWIDTEDEDYFEEK